MDWINWMVNFQIAPPRTIQSEAAPHFSIKCPPLPPRGITRVLLHCRAMPRARRGKPAWTLSRNHHQASQRWLSTRPNCNRGNQRSSRIERHPCRPWPQPSHPLSLLSVRSSCCKDTLKTRFMQGISFKKIKINFHPIISFFLT